MTMSTNDAVRKLDHIINLFSLNHQNSLLPSAAEYSVFTKMKNKTYLYHPFPAESMDENYAEFLFRKGIADDLRRWYSEEQSKQMNDTDTAEMSGSKVVLCYG